jgi:hypothetical protein
MDKMTTIKNYLESWVKGADYLGHPEAHLCAHSYFLKHGKEYPSKMLTQDETMELQEVLRRATWSFEIKQCFANAQRLVMVDSAEFEYAEGFALADTIPLHHGWALWKGHPIDVTWGIASDFDVNRKQRIVQRVLRNMLSNAYFGVPIETHRISKVWLKERCARPLLEDLLREESAKAVARDPA